MSKPLELAARMNIQAAKELHSSLAAVLSDDVEVDASAVEFLGGLAAQTLIAAQRSLESHQKRLIIRNPSGAFRSCVTEMGLENLLKTEGANAC